MSETIELSTMSGEQLRALRQSLGLSQRETADLIGVELRGYQRWEGEERSVPPPVQRLVRLMAENPIVLHWLKAYAP